MAYPVLRSGQSGPNVSAWQNALRKAGYNITPTGLYNNQTLTAVLALQKKAGIRQDGITGPETYTAFRRLYPVIALGVTSGFMLTSTALANAALKAVKRPEKKTVIEKAKAKIKKAAPVKKAAFPVLGLAAAGALVLVFFMTRRKGRRK